MKANQNTRHLDHQVRMICSHHRSLVNVHAAIRVDDGFLCLQRIRHQGIARVNYFYPGGGSQYLYYARCFGEQLDLYRPGNWESIIRKEYETVLAAQLDIPLDQHQVMYFTGDERFKPFDIPVKPESNE